MLGRLYIGYAFRMEQLEKCSIRKNVLFGKCSTENVKFEKKNSIRKMFNLENCLICENV